MPQWARCTLRKFMSMLKLWVRRHLIVAHQQDRQSKVMLTYLAQIKLFFVPTNASSPMALKYWVKLRKSLMLGEMHITRIHGRPSSYGWHEILKEITSRRFWLNSSLHKLTWVTQLILQILPISAFSPGTEHFILILLLNILCTFF